MTQKLTLLQANFISEQVLGQFFADYSYTFGVLSGAPSPIQADTSFERAIATFRGGWLPLVAYQQDRESQLLALNTIAAEQSWVFTQIFARALAVMALAPTSWPGTSVLYTYFAGAFALLPDMFPASEVSGGGGGSSLTAQDIANAIGAAVTGSPYYLIYPGSEVYPEDD